jgi:hypothetical protein
MRQFVALVGLAVALAITAACEAHAGVKINNNPSVQHHYRPADAQTQLVR